MCDSLDCKQGARKRIDQLENQIESVTDWIAETAMKDDGAVFSAGTDTTAQTPITYEDLRVLMASVEVPYVGPTIKPRAVLEKELEAATLERDLLRRQLDELRAKAIENKKEEHKCNFPCEQCDPWFYKGEPQP